MSWYSVKSAGNRQCIVEADMSLKDIIEEYGSMIFGIVVVGSILTGVVTQLSPGGLLYNLLDRVLSACVGGI